MTYFILGLIIVFSGLVLVNKRRTSTFDIDRIQTDLQKGAQLLDVRTVEEYAKSHAKGARSFPLQKLQAGKMPSANKDMGIYLYCHSGARALTAAQKLKQAGFTNVNNLKSLSNWQRNGGKVVK